MKQKTTIIGLTALTAIVIGSLLLIPRIARAHCDTMDGPIVITAMKALEKGDVTPVLKWVKKDNEEEVRALFKKAVATRKKGKEAKELADMYFFETLVRLHRAGEGALYDGLKPAGTTAHIVARSDKALETGSVDELINHLSIVMGNGIRKYFENVVEKKKHADESVEAGREYVEAYVEYVHYVERVHDGIISMAGPHEEPTEKE
jgi:hypothetical protein